MPDALTDVDALDPTGDLAPDPIQRMLTAARTAAGMDVALVTSIQDGLQTIVRLDGDGGTFGWEPGSAGPAADGYCQYVLAGQLPNIVPDSLANPLTFQLPSTHAAQIGSYAGVPLTLSNGRVYGALCVTSHRPGHHLGASDVAFLRFLAEMIASELAAQEARRMSRAAQQERLTTYLAPGAITILAQPIVDLVDGRIRGVEALSRFSGHAGSPADVFAAAGQAGLGVDLELAAVRAAVDLLPRLPEHVYLSVNASPDTVLDQALHRALAVVDGRRIVLELTEHVAFTHQGELTNALSELRRHGCRVAVDDTGAGYASLQNILSLAPEVIKLDLAIVKGIDRDPVRRALARALSGFASECGASLVAEGIETLGELTTLQRKGVHLGQGYYLSRPVPVDSIDFDHQFT
jgi:EAL domain-containing protein (putative c-di-GMP-specific phosphodiesterase class I)